MDRTDGNAASTKRGQRAAVMRPRRFFGPGDAHEDIVDAETAIFFIDAKTPDAQRTDFFVHLPGNFARFVPLIGKRLQLGLGKTAAGFSELAALVIIEGA